MQNNTIFGYSKTSSLIVLDKVSSTNDYSKQLFTNFKPQLPFTAIMAKEQTSGKGQRGSSWISKPNENLTVSYVHFPSNLNIEDQFIITIISSLATYDVLKKHISSPIHIKWPNDIFINNKKIAGILIENKIASVGIKQSIIGIGINVYTKEFPAEITTNTTSVILENYEFNLTIIDLALELQQRLVYYDNLYISGQSDSLWKMYSDLLFRKNILAKYKVGEKNIDGEIIGVNRDGRLIMKVNDELINYDLKDILYHL